MQYKSLFLELMRHGIVVLCLCLITYAMQKDIDFFCNLLALIVFGNMAEFVASQPYTPLEHNSHKLRDCMGLTFMQYNKQHCLHFCITCNSPFLTQHCLLKGL